MAKTYTVTVLTGGQDDHSQLARIMDVPGYSHLTNRRTVYKAGYNLPAADAVLTGYTNKQVAQKAVDAVLGDTKWDNTNIVQIWRGQ